ncbi:SHOCT domain-containing protein [Nocardia sp. NBC_01327]|uniref:SHOCT domain-containing protein n=1 Tax=Nocardia sp. NBC_01327 TaxID=2903593 RepID=UPI002E132CCE|nr:SHOCT domain-containing protein [Nocardia sp. NBC_01327]
MKGRVGMVDKPTSHGLGFGNGSLIEHPDGTVEYRQTGKLLTAFRVRVRDVTGFSVRKATRDDKKRLKATALQQVLTVQGSGTTLAEVAINHGTAEKIETWFRSHGDFGDGAPSQAASVQGSPFAVPNSVADELLKLAQLRDTGILTADEFEAQKSKLLA